MNTVKPYKVLSFMSTQVLEPGAETFRRRRSLEKQIINLTEEGSQMYNNNAKEVLIYRRREGNKQTKSKQAGNGKYR